MSNIKQLGKTGITISSIGLGTVEIGIPYGLENRLPLDAEAENVLKKAVEVGVTYFDTARGYGVAEERIGKAGIAKLPGITVGTKCAQFLEKGEDPHGQELEQRIRADIETSLRMLQVDSLPLVMYHGGSVEQIKRGELIEIAQKLTNEGKVQNWGIATRGAEAPLAAIESGFFKAIETAYSILDQRMNEQVLPLAHEKGIGIINRSVLLKGALTPAHPRLPQELAQLKENAAKAQATAEQLGIDLPSLAIRFVLSNEAISTALIGTMKPEHLEHAIRAAETGPLPTEIIAELKTLAITEPKQVDPSLWPKLA